MGLTRLYRIPHPGGDWSDGLMEWLGRGPAGVPALKWYVPRMGALLPGHGLDCESKAFIYCCVPRKKKTWVGNQGLKTG